jgi:glycosyltransferase involved in cell wall biosynthesis
MSSSKEPGAPVVRFVHGSSEMYGSDKVLLYLVENLVQQGEFGVLVVLHETGPLQAALRAAGAEVHVAAVTKITRQMFRPSAALALLRMIRQTVCEFDRVVSGRDIAVVHSNTLAVLGGAAWAAVRGRPHLWHVHEIILKPAMVRRGLPWLAALFARRVIANSTPTREWLLSQAPRLANRTDVVFNGLPPLPAPNPQASQSFRRELGATDSDVVATVAGRLNHWKGQGLLIAAAARLKREGRLGRLKFAIVGSVFAGHEDLLSGLQRQVAEEQLGDIVRFISFVDDIYSVWRGSQIAVVPSTEPEPFGMVAIEAMACGLPVVAAGHGGLLDIVEHESTGLLFKPRAVIELAAALHRLAGDADLRQRLGQAGACRQAQHFSIREQAARTAGIYREMIGR